MSEGADRVAELEERVAELEATVRGLTEELVDASERVRTLEAELDTSPSTEELRDEREETPVTGEGAGGEATKGTGGENPDNEESGLDDIIVA